MPPISKRFTPHSAHQAQRSRTQQTPAHTSQEREAPPDRDSVNLSKEALRGSAASIDEEREQALLRTYGGKGFAVPIHQGAKNKPVTLTVHGINGSPDSVKALSDAAARRGETVHAFLYNDQKGGLSDSSADLAKAITDIRRKHPGQKLNIASHSMGGRISADALRKLHEQGKLTGSAIEQQMYGPMIGGNAMANTARWAPGLLDGAIKGLKPGREMGTNSAFQKTLESTALPGNVRTRILVGEQDHLVDPNGKHFQAVADGLNAQTQVLPGLDHESVLQRPR